MLAAACLQAGPAHATDTPFATRVLQYTPAIGQSVQSPAFNNPQQALGAPLGGGTTSPDNAKLVTLGSFGGSITLAFDTPIPNLPPSPANPLGADFIVFGNAFYVFGNPALRWMEPGVIEASIDLNANGLADDPWYTLRGSRWIEQDASDPLAPPGVKQTNRLITASSVPASWIPAHRAGQPSWIESAWELSGEGFAGPSGSPIVADPADGSITWGYADCSPTLLLGDLDGDNIVDAPAIDPARFYSCPPRSDLPAGARTPFSGGGDAITIEGAIDSQGRPVTLQAIDFVRIRSAVVSDFTSPFGENSVEVGGVSRVLIRPRADMGGQGGSLGHDGIIDNNDFIVFIDLFFSQSPLADLGSEGGAEGPDGTFDNNDFIVFISWVFAGE
jgi:hypothetical protein